MGRKLVVDYAADILSLEESEVVALCEQGRIPGAEIDPRDGDWVVDEDVFNDWHSANHGRPFG